MLKITNKTPNDPPCGDCHKHISFNYDDNGIRYGKCGCSLWYWHKNDWKWYAKIDENRLTIEEQTNPDAF